MCMGKHTKALKWRSEDNSEELVLFFHFHGSYRNGTQITKIVPQVPLLRVLSMAHISLLPFQTRSHYVALANLELTS